MITAPHVANLIKLLGEPVLLLSWPAGVKATKKKWGHLTVEDMKRPAYLAQLAHGNIGVAVGEKSGGLCSIDIDGDEYVAAFDAANPALQATLRSIGSRGCNVWLRIEGSYPNATKTLKTTAGAKWGEWRSTGGQTIIYGQHPTGRNYTNNGKRVVKIEFGKIVWPKIISNPPGIDPQADNLPCTQGHKGTRVQAYKGTRAQSNKGTPYVSLCPCFFVYTVEAAVKISLPRHSHTTHKSLFKLAGALWAYEETTKTTIKVGELRGIFRQWYAKATPFLNKDQSEEEYFLEFMNAWNNVDHPLGDNPVVLAWKRAQAAPTPPEATAAGLENPDACLLASLCREMQLISGDEPFYLSPYQASGLLQKENHSTVARWLSGFCGLKILTLVERGIPRLKAASYRFNFMSPSDNGEDCGKTPKPKP
jgi:hypothetical protein